MYTYSDDGFDRLKKREGKKLKAYYDSGNKLTIGYGHTNDSYFSFTISTIIDDAKADDLLHHDVKEAADCINKYVKVPLTQKQFDALVSFVYSIGNTKFISSTLLKKLNAGNYSAVPTEMMRWNKDQDKKTGKLVTVEGLTNRRSSEVGEWASGSFVSSSNVSSTTTITALDKIAKPLTQSTTALAAVGTTVTTTVSAFSGLDWRAACLFMLIAAAFAGYIIYQRNEHKKIAQAQEG